QIEHLCNRVIYLDKGKVKLLDTPEQAIARYYMDFDSSTKIERGIRKEETIKFEDVYFEDNKGERINRIAIFEDVKLILKFKCIDEMIDSTFDFRIYQPNGIQLTRFDFQTAFAKNDRESHQLEIEIRNLNLPPGKYYLEIKVAEKAYIGGIWYNALNFEIYAKTSHLLQHRSGYCILDAHCKSD
ncbi:Wzt carbohydrate-binding domain-containing protein, partial [bacterium]|nr:Wzt carbohydrate-binding domain-containing protein [bacterium]